jgi:peroxiredoxin Q/BCP
MACVIPLYDLNFDGASFMLKHGTPAPAFTLPDENEAPRTLSGLLEVGPLVLYFYPADFTPVCTAEACAFRDLDPGLTDAGLVLAGVSPQSPTSHAKFRERYQLPFPLLSDADRSVCKAYSAALPFGLGTRRVTYLINQAGRIVDGVEANLSVGRHTAFIERAIETATASSGPATPRQPDPEQS